jgi:hypothetical protein
MADVEKIRFRCWKCHHKYVVASQRIGKQITCTCGETIRVPKRDGGKCRIKTPLDWIIEFVLCAGGGAAIGFVLGMLIVSQLFRGFYSYSFSFTIIGGLTCGGGLIGLFGGEKAIDWLGDQIRKHERD